MNSGWEGEGVRIVPPPGYPVFKNIYSADVTKIRFQGLVHPQVRREKFSINSIINNKHHVLFGAISPQAFRFFSFILYFFLASFSSSFCLAAKFAGDGIAFRFSMLIEL